MTQQIMLDLEALALEREKRLKTLRLENAQLDGTIRTRSERDRLIALKEREQLGLEIAQLDKQITELRRLAAEVIKMSGDRCLIPLGERRRIGRHLKSCLRNVYDQVTINERR